MTHILPAIVVFLQDQGSTFNNATQFSVNVVTPIAPAVTMQFSTVDSISWFERGSAFPESESEFQPRADLTLGPMLLSLGEGEFEVESTLVVRHRYPYTFKKGGGKIAASPRSDFCNQVQEFRILKSGDEFQMSVGDDREYEWTHMPVLSNTFWDISVGLSINDGETIPLVGRIDTTVQGIVLPPVVFDDVADRIGATGAELVPLNAVGGSTIYNCKKQFLPEIFISVGSDIRIQIPIVFAYTAPGKCLSHLLRGHEGDVVHLGEEFLAPFVVNFDSTVGVVSLAENSLTVVA